MYKLIIKLTLIFVLILSGFSKLVNPRPTLDVLQSIPLFPERFIIPTITFLPLFEIILALLLILRYEQDLIVILCNGLFLFFFLFSIYGVAMGIDKECGCFGNLVKSYFDWKMILRNFIFLTFSSYLTYNNFKSSKKMVNGEGNNVRCFQ
ncbi:MAG: MauE/DoxX family redox-associated membrane protein [Fidelibacterota bacterium]